MPSYWTQFDNTLHKTMGDLGHTGAFNDRLHKYLTSLGHNGASVSDKVCQKRGKI